MLDLGSGLVLTTALERETGGQWLYRLICDKFLLDFTRIVPAMKAIIGPVFHVLGGVNKFVGDVMVYLPTFQISKQVLPRAVEFMIQFETRLKGWLSR